MFVVGFRTKWIQLISGIYHHSFGITQIQGNCPTIHVFFHKKRLERIKGERVG
jgi:hypothetical protein